MTLLWTDVAIDQVLSGWEDMKPHFQQIERHGVTLIVAPLENGMGRIERLISPNPQHYLKPAWQPGALVTLSVFTQ